MLENFVLQSMFAITQKQFNTPHELPYQCQQFQLKVHCSLNMFLVLFIMLIVFFPEHTRLAFGSLQDLSENQCVMKCSNFCQSTSRVFTMIYKVKTINYSTRHLDWKRCLLSENQLSYQAKIWAVIWYKKLARWLLASQFSWQSLNASKLLFFTL